MNIWFYDVIAMETREENNTMELEIIQRKTAPLFQDVCLSGNQVAMGVCREIKCIILISPSVLCPTSDSSL